MTKKSPSQRSMSWHKLQWTGAITAAAIALPIAGHLWKIYRNNQKTRNTVLQPLPEIKDSDRILILSPHPDDETLACGGLIAHARRRKVPVRTLFLTSGDGSLSTRLVRDVHMLGRTGSMNNSNGNAYQNMAAIRKEEAKAALAQLGAPAKDAIFLGYPDGGTCSMWKNPSQLYYSRRTNTNHCPYNDSWTPNAPYRCKQVVSDLRQIITEFRPTIVMTTDPRDIHSDHFAACAYLQTAVEQLRKDSENNPWAQQIRGYTFLVHRGPWPAPQGYFPYLLLTPPATLVRKNEVWFTFSLSQDLLKQKTAALSCYRSQLDVTPRYLRSFLRQNELFAPMIFST